MLNVTTNLFHSFDIRLRNSFTPLENIDDTAFIDSPGSDTHFRPPKCSSPIGTRRRRVLSSVQSTSSALALSSEPKTPSTVSKSAESQSIPYQVLPPNINAWCSIIVNANSINGKRAEFEALLSYTSPDLILITETKLGNDIKTSEFMPSNSGYTVYRKDRKRGGGGVLIAIKDCYTHVQVEMKDITCEILWIEVNLVNCKKLYAGCFYRPPDTGIEYLDSFEESLKIIEAKTRNNPGASILLGGDFNAKDINWDSNTVSSTSGRKNLHTRLLDIVGSFHLSQHQLGPTCEESILDLFFTNKPGIVRSMHTIPGLSDHDIPVADCDLKPSINKKQPRKLFQFHRANWDSIRAATLTFAENFLAEYKDRSVDMNWRMFVDHIKSSMDKFIPSKLSSTRYNLPWVNARIRRLINKKHRLYNKAKASHKESDWAKYKTQKRLVVKALRQARWNYINNVLLESLKTNDTKPFWRYVKSKRQERVGIAPLCSGGTLMTDAKDKAQVLNAQFQSVFTVDDNSVPANMSDPSFPAIHDLVIDPIGVAKLLGNINPKKACGPDGIPCIVLKELALELAPVLTALFEQSIVSGSLPEDWLKAYINPIFKKGNQNMAENYRPVSLTCVCSKLLEHIICTHIWEHLDQHNIITDKQHGFRRRHSCESQLIITTQDLFQLRDSNVQVDMAILDFSKAFDTVPHDKLLFKLDHYGIKGPILTWISAFLKQRDQCVVVDGVHSDWVHVDSGVPQGTVLGPLLFLLHINDLPSRVTSRVRLFADDCLVYRPIHCANDQLEMQRDLDSLREWSDQWGMRFNPAKCNIMRFHRSKTPLERFYTLCDQVLAQVDDAKYLGVNLSHNLEWSSHIDAVASKSNQSLGFIRRNLNECPKELRQTAYFSLVRSTLEYACTVWDPHLVKDINSLEKVQRLAACVGKALRTAAETCVYVSCIRSFMGWSIYPLQTS